jgi:transposase-like protein
MTDATSAPFNWRDHLPVHPAANEFDLLSEKDPKALRDMAEDIRKNGLQQPIVVVRIALADNSQAGMLPVPTGEYVYKLLDGRNRLDALALLGRVKAPLERGKGERRSIHQDLPVIENHAETHNASSAKSDWSFYYRIVNATEYNEEDERELYDLVLSLNAHRRNLTPEKKRELIAKLLKANPDQSNRSIAKQVNVDHHKVAKVRQRLEATGEVSPVEKTVGADGKARNQPSKKAERTPTLSPALGDDLFVTDDQQIKNLKAIAYMRRVASAAGMPTADDIADSGMIDSGGDPQMVEFSPAVKQQIKRVWSKLSAEEQDLLVRWRQRHCIDEASDERDASDVTSAAINDQAERDEAKPSHVEETHKFYRELGNFVTGFESRLRLWSQSTPLPTEAKDCLHEALMRAADTLMTLAQEVDGRGAKQIAEAA